MNRLRALEHWDCGFESHSRHGCLLAFSLCVSSGLAQGSMPIVYRIKKLKRPEPNKRAVDREYLKYNYGHFINIIRISS
jgi:hypothetical protein